MLNPSWKISSSAVDGQSFFVIDGSLLNPDWPSVEELILYPRSLLPRPCFFLSWRRARARSHDSFLTGGQVQKDKEMAAIKERNPPPAQVFIRHEVE